MFPRTVCEALVQQDFLAPLHDMVELSDGDGFLIYTKRGHARYVRGQTYQLTVAGLEWNRYAALAGGKE